MVSTWFRWLSISIVRISIDRRRITFLEILIGQSDPLLIYDKIPS